MTNDRLDELATYTTEEDTPDDARVSLPWRDLRDLVALIPVVRAAFVWNERQRIFGIEPECAVAEFMAVVDELRAKGAG